MSRGPTSVNEKTVSVVIPDASIPALKDMPKFEILEKIMVKDMEPFIDTDTYKEAHSEADQLEKKMFPLGYKKLSELEKTMPKDQLLGMNDPYGRLYVSMLVPKALRLEVAYHEWVESLARKRLKKESKQ